MVRIEPQPEPTTPTTEHGDDDADDEKNDEYNDDDIDDDIDESEANYKDVITGIRGDNISKSGENGKLGY